MSRLFVYLGWFFVKDWFGSLSKGSIATYSNLTKNFMRYFTCNIQKKKYFSYLYLVKQKSLESLADFLGQWKKEVTNVHI